MNKQQIAQALDALIELEKHYGATTGIKHVGGTSAIAALRSERDSVAEPTHYVDAMGIVYTAKRAKFIGMALDSMTALSTHPLAQPVIDLEALNKDLIDYRDQITRLRGAIGVMAKLLDASLEVLETLDPESEEEAGNLRVLRQQIRAAIDPMVVL
jgi:hypothetical protein